MAKKERHVKATLRTVCRLLWCVMVGHKFGYRTYAPRYGIFGGSSSTWKCECKRCGMILYY